MTVIGHIVKAIIGIAVHIVRTVQAAVPFLRVKILHIIK